MTIPRIPLAALAALTLTFTLVACSSEPPTAETPTPKPAKTAEESEPSTVETPEPEETAAAEPTCETIIAPTTVQALTELDWTVQQEEFRIGADVIEGGLHCVWGDYSVASDHVQVFGWAPLDASAAASAQQKLLSEGWSRADDDGHLYITENPEFAFSTDDEGFGMTYEFGEGWVSVADTKQSLVLVDWP